MSWQRKWFFWMEALQITAGERRIVLLLLATGMISTGVAQFGPSRTIYDQQYYVPVIAEFKRLSEVQETERAALLARYYPRDERITDTGESGSDFLQQDEQDDHKRKPVRIQSAGKEELVTLPGIGPVTAGRILEYREENGTFKNLDDLMNVSGIGPVTIENIRDLIVFD